MRDQGRANLGYYPMNSAVAPLIASQLFLQPEGTITIADLCAGEGEMLYHLTLALAAKHKKVIPYGIELSSERHRKMLKRFTDETGKGKSRFLCGAAEFAHISAHSLSVLYLNPPFDNDGNEELRWLDFTSKWVKTGGVVIFVTTHAHASKRTTSYEFTQIYEWLGQFYVPQEYSKYDEVIVFGRKRERNISSWDQSLEKKDYPTLALAEVAPFMVPAVERAVEKFIVAMPDLSTALKALDEFGVTASGEWNQLIVPRTFAERQPILDELRDGHTANLIAGGMMDSMTMRDPELGNLIITGSSTKERSTPERVNDGEEQKFVVHEQPVITINAMNIDDGKVHTFSTKEPGVMTDFVMRHLDVFRDTIHRDFPPQFKVTKHAPKFLDIAGWIGSPGVVSNLTRVRMADGTKATVADVKKNENGERVPTAVKLDDGRVVGCTLEDISHVYRLPLPAQFLHASAAAFHLTNNKYAAVIAEMGSGKTSIAMSTLIMKLQNRIDKIMKGEDSEKIIILMPGHLVHNWTREAKAVLSKLEEAYRVDVPIVIPGHVERFHRAYGYDASKKKITCGHCGTINKISGKTHEEVEGKLERRNMVNCEHCGKTMFARYSTVYQDIDDLFAAPGLGILILSETHAKLGAPWRYSFVPKLEHKREVMSRALAEEPVMTCPTCGGIHIIKTSKGDIIDDPFVHYEKRPANRQKLFCQNTVQTRREYDEEGRVMMEVLPVEVRVPANVEFVQDIDVKTGEPLFNDDGSPRMVEYRPGTKYLSTGKNIEWQAISMEVVQPARKDEACGTPMFSFTRFGDNMEQFEAETIALSTGKHVRRFTLKPNYDFEKGELVEAKTGSARASIGEYIAARYARRYALIADEIQIFKSGDSSRGMIMGKLATNSKWTLGLTGTIYNGKASGLFYLLHRMSPEFRRLYRYDQVSKFVDEYGVNDIYITMQKAKVKAGVKGFGGKAFVEHVSKREANGCMPDIVQWLLPYATFMDLADLNIELPPAVSEFHWVPVDPEVQPEMDVLKKIREDASSDAVKGDMSKLSAWIQAAIGWILAPDQDETWIHPKDRERVEEYEKLAAKYMVEGNADEADKYLKIAEEHRVKTTEVWLKARLFSADWPAPRLTSEVAARIAQDAALGDRAIIFVSGQKRPAAKSIYKMCKAAGLKPFVLTTKSDMTIKTWCEKEDYADCDRDEREAAIRDAVDRDYNVLICNPELIATGLNLIMFNHVHLVGVPHRSLFVIAQAMRRVVRPGQNKKVIIHTWAYGEDPRKSQSQKDNHIQALAALAMAEKMKAAAVVMGNVGEALSALSAGQDDITQVVRKAVLKDELPQFSDDNKALFESKVEDNPFLDYVRDLLEERDDYRIGFTDKVRRVDTFDLEPDTVDAEWVEDAPALIPASVDQVVEEAFAAAEHEDGRYRLLTDDEWAALPTLEDLARGENNPALYRIYNPETNWIWYVQGRVNNTDLLTGWVAGFVFEGGDFSLSELEEAQCVRDFEFEPTSIADLAQVHGDFIQRTDLNGQEEDQEIVVEVMDWPEPEVIAPELPVEAAPEAVVEPEPEVVPDDHELDPEPEPEPAPYVPDVEEVLGFLWPHDARLSVLRVTEVVDADSRRIWREHLYGMYN